MRIARSLGATLLAACVIAMVSCTGGTPAPVGLAQGCSINSDCEGALVCVFGLCHIACVTSKDCNGAACILPGVCQLPAETKCSSTLPCVSGLACVGDTCLATCGSAGSGVAVTVADGVCLVDQACVQVAGVDVCEPLSADAGPDATRTDGGSRDAAHPSEAAVDAGKDSGRDSTVPREAAVDSGKDSGRDRTVPSEAAVDSGKDAAHDATVPTDAGVDSGRDAAHDSAEDSSKDATRDGAKDSGTDASRDGAPESSVDAGVDSGTDAAPAEASASCPSAQTQFGNIGTGTAMTEFQSGVGARNASQMFIFDGYYGPVPSGVDAGGDAGNGGNIPIVFAQAFDPHTGNPQGPATPLFVPPVSPELNNPGAGRDPILLSSAVSTSGYIALVYEVLYANITAALYLAILRPSVDAGSDSGVAGLELETAVLLQGVGEAQGGGEGQPFVIWSDTIQAFVVSWQYSASNNYMAVSSYSIAGNAVGVGLGTVPTDDNGVVSIGNGYGSVASVGISGGLFGVAYLDNLTGNPAITVFNEEDIQIGPSLGVEPTTPRFGGNWVSTAGTATGFVYFFDNVSGTAEGVSEVFLPVSQDAGILGSFPDGGADAHPFSTFNFPSNVRAEDGRVIADGQGGAGGVGAAFSYPEEISFAYVNSDGVTYRGPGTVFPHQWSSGDLVSMTNFAGSFVVSLYNSVEHRTVVAATGCQTP